MSNVAGMSFKNVFGKGNVKEPPKHHDTRKNSILKVVVLGNKGVGKSSILLRFVENRFGSVFSTVGVDFLSKDFEIAGDSYTLQIWDTAGQERFRSLRTPFYRGADACLLTYAVNNLNSFQAISEWHREFLSYTDVKEGSSFPFVVVGNKADVNVDDREVTPEQVEAWCQANDNLPYIETSAKDAINIEEAFRLVVKQWAKNDITNHYYESEKINLHHPRTSPKELCCINS